MLCKRPFIKDPSGQVFRRPGLVASGLKEWSEGLAFGCGQCLACRINRRRVWTARLVLESYLHEKACFVTLTYRDDDLVYNENYIPTLCKRDLQLFLKRLRKHFSERKIRYYACGEYGTRSLRPHYHLVLFGIAPEELDETFMLYDGKSPRSLLLNLWTFGLVHVGECSRHSIQYVAGYVTKKYTKKGDGLQKEFSLMSLKPGIGAGALDAIRSAIDGTGTECAMVRFEGKTWPLGRYLLQKMYPDGRQVGFLSYVADFAKVFRESRQRNIGILEYLAEKNDPRLVQLETRQKIFNTRDAI